MTQLEYDALVANLAARLRSDLQRTHPAQLRLTDLIEKTTKQAKLVLEEHGGPHECECELCKDVAALVYSLETIGSLVDGELKEKRRPRPRRRPLRRR